MVVVYGGLVPTQVQPMRLYLGDSVGTEPPQTAAKVSPGMLSRVYRVCQVSKYATTFD